MVNISYERKPPKRPAVLQYVAGVINTTVGPMQTLVDQAGGFSQWDISQSGIRAVKL